MTTDLSKVPLLEFLRDEELMVCFSQNVRETDTFTYGFILQAKNEQGKYLSGMNCIRMEKKRANVRKKLMST